MRCKRRWVRLASTIATAAVVTILAYGNVRGWSGGVRRETFATFDECGGRHIVLNAMSSDRDGAYAAVVTYAGYDVAKQRVGAERASLQSDLVCVRKDTMMLASASLSDTGDRLPQVVMLDPEGVRHNLTGCIEDIFTDCESDGKFSMVRRNRRWWLYMDARLCASGRCRFLQMATKDEWGRVWSAFTLKTLDGFTNETDAIDIYFFDITTNGTSMRARFPAIVGERGGIFEVTSEQGLLWSAPREVWAISTFDEHTKLQPLGIEYLMRIDLFE